MTKIIKQIVYESNAFPDMNANTMFANATESGLIDTIPEMPGLGVWHDGHAGIYVGNGYVIHANGTHRGVEKQLLSDTKFTHWFKITGVSMRKRYLKVMKLSRHNNIHN